MEDLNWFEKAVIWLAARYVKLVDSAAVAFRGVVSTLAGTRRAS